MEELIAAVGPDTWLVVRGEQVVASEAEGRIPAYYFPIVSAADLSVKLDDLAWPGAGYDWEQWSWQSMPVNEDDDGGWS